MKNKIYFHNPRRKWENDIVNSKYDNFEFFPKEFIKYDGQVVQSRFNNIKSRLKKIKIIKFLWNIRYKIIAKKNIYLGKHNIKGEYDGAVISQFFLKNNNHKKIPYITYIENSHSILNYSYEKFENIKIRNKIEKELKKMIYDPNFKGFIFYSEKSKISFYKYFEGIIDNDFKYIDVIYPMIKDNKSINIDVIEEKIKSRLKCFKLTFISSRFSLKGGCEIVEAYKNIKDKINIKIDFITDEKSIPPKYLEYIKNDENLNILKNNLSNEELIEQFNNTHVLLHPTYMDSTAIVVMEALNSAVPSITTDTFAIPEYIEHGINGYIIKNPIKYVDDNYKPLKPYNFFGSYDTVNYINEIKASTLDKVMVSSLENYIEKCYDNYEILSKNCYKKIKYYNFNENNTLKKWNNIINKYLIS